MASSDIHSASFLNMHHIHNVSRDQVRVEISIPSDIDECNGLEGKHHRAHSHYCINKITATGSVTISSIPPRTDDAKAQENVEIANACLISLTDQHNMTFANNDSSLNFQILA